MAGDDTRNLDQAAASGDSSATLLAVSTTASPDDTKKAVIYNCIVSTFFNEGFPEINSQDAKIVWSIIDDSIIVALGNGVTNCINGKGYQCPPLATAFATLKEMGQVTVVSDLVTGIAALVKP